MFCVDRLISLEIELYCLFIYFIVQIEFQGRIANCKLKCLSYCKIKNILFDGVIVTDCVSTMKKKTVLCFVSLKYIYFVQGLCGLIVMPAAMLLTNHSLHISLNI